MGAFAGPGGSVLLVRNHEVNNPQPAFGPTKPYDKRGGAGHDDDPGDEVRRGAGRLHQPERHDDELQRRPDAVGRLGHLRGDRQRPRRRPRLHRARPTCRCRSATATSSRSPAGGLADARPLRKAGRFAHEAVSYDPAEGVLYLTEDNFAVPVRVLPLRAPRAAATATGDLDHNGQLQMLAVEGRPQPAPRGSPGHHDRPRRRVGRHRRAGRRVPLHAGRGRRRRATTPRSTSWATRAGRRAPPTSRAARARSSTTASSTSPPPRAEVRR